MLDTSTSAIKKCHESREPSRPNQQPLLMLLATPRFLIDLTFSIPGTVIGNGDLSKLLNFRDTVRPFIRSKVDNGEGTFLWFDNRHPFGPEVW